MQAFYDNEPSKLEAVGNGSFLYRYNIAEVEVESEEPRTQWQCDEVTVWSPVTRDVMTRVVINETWSKNYEQKLVNEYNGALLGVYGAKTSAAAKEKIANYTAFLKQREALKSTIDADCDELHIK